MAFILNMNANVILHFIHDILSYFQLFVHVTNIENGLEYYWPREKFYNRKSVMTELFNKFDDDDDDFNGQIADVSRHWKNV